MHLGNHLLSKKTLRLMGLGWTLLRMSQLEAAVDAFKQSLALKKTLRLIWVLGMRC